MSVVDAITYFALTGILLYGLCAIALIYLRVYDGIRSRWWDYLERERQRILQEDQEELDMLFMDPEFDKKYFCIGLRPDGEGVLPRTIIDELKGN